MGIGSLLSLADVGFWVLLVLGHERLGRKGIVIAVTLWAGLWLACSFNEFTATIFPSIVALLDAVLIAIIYRSSIRLG